MSITEINQPRKRALAHINKDDWLNHNPLFKSFIPEFNSAFNRGSSLNLDYYQDREKNASLMRYEDEICESLFPTDNNPKLSYLSAKVGNGKTCLCRYITKELNNQNDCFAFRVEIGSLKNDTSNIMKLFTNAILKELQKKTIVEHKGDFCKKVFCLAGFPDLTSSEMFDRYYNLPYTDIINYIDSLPEVKNILIIIDNIDECSLKVINYCKDFAMRLKNHCTNLDKKYSILLPARGHTARKYFDQKHFADFKLPKIDETELIKKALSQSIDEIEKSIRHYSQPIEYPKIRGPYKFPSYTVTITNESAKIFFNRLIDTVTTKESIFWFLCRTLSNKNYKIMISHMYNFIHSCKLPLIPLFNQIWLKDFYYTHDLTVPDIIPFDLGLETLLASHYPFYDVDISHVVNIFNLKNSTISGDFRNTLITIRLLCFLKNNKHRNIILAEIQEEFSKYGYLRDDVDIAIEEKCFAYGLLDAPNGNHLKDLEGTSEIKISPIGEFYIDILICSDTYLSFMADDTPVPNNFYRDIGKKYEKQKNVDFHKIKKRATSIFIRFVEAEEKLEKNFLENKNYNYNDFLSRMSMPIDSKPQTISKYIESRRNQSINIDMLNVYL